MLREACERLEEWLNLSRRDVAPADIRLLLAAVQASKSDDQLIEERDDAEQAMSQAYYLVTGRSPEWSNLFGYQQAHQEIADAVNVLKQAAKASSRQDDLLETAWGIIANAGGGDWDRGHQHWKTAAGRWRDSYHAYLAMSELPPPPAEGGRT